MRTRACRRATVLLVAVTIGAGETFPADARADSLAGADPVVAAGDRAWERRNEGRAGARASPRKISEAISRYEEAARSPDAVEPRWKLARSLFFKAKYTGLSGSSQLALFDKARVVGEEAIAILHERTGAAGSSISRDARPPQVAAALSSDREAAPTFFWTSVAWGEWGLLAGRVRAAKTGAATRIRDYATTVIHLDPRFGDGGGYRILGRLHHRAPRIPYLTGWVSRAEALENLRLAVRAGPRNFVNRHFLAEALADGERAEKNEAIRIERSLLSDAPSPGHLVEDLAIQEEARRNLAAWIGKS